KARLGTASDALNGSTHSWRVLGNSISSRGPSPAFLRPLERISCWKNPADSRPWQMETVRTFTRGCDAAEHPLPRGHRQFRMMVEFDEPCRISEHEQMVVNDVHQVNE